ncbi:DUF2306 domain-containing protein [uncultured Kordia sp.]|uniref:DUF2306 domain-containing protein n=1 Tax=uncultured Kordia sp. TaxID=507699 RepID=UPI00260F5372|nr:DUF2306 domain-containing protein [uncultured Kordia sp.]
MKKLAWLVLAYLCIYISFRPLKYFLADVPIDLLANKPDEVLSSMVYMTVFYIHITFGGIALLVGWFQFIKKFRDKFRKVHRIIGKIYVFSVFISAPVGFYIGFFASGGLVTQIGFTFGAFIWFVITYLAYKAIRNGNVAKHREYMIYSYVGSFAAVMLRFILYPLIQITGDFAFAYSISVWASWLPNIGIAYLWIHKKELLVSIYEKYRIKKVLIGLFIIVGTIVMVSYMSPQTWLYKSAAFEGEAFEKTSSLANSVFTEEKLQEIDTYLKEESETTSMIVLENGKIVYEYGDVSEISYNASVRKSILAMLYGKYVENGTIDLNQTIGDMGIDEDDGLLAIEKQAKIDHIVTARSGVFHLPSNDGYDTNNLKKRGSVQPGTYFLYNNWDFNLAGFILEDKIGKTVYKELEEQLAIPLGFQDWNLLNQDKTVNTAKSRYSAYNMHLSTRDMAKIGQLMLQEGKWNGKQLISKDWIRKIVTTVTPKDTVNKRYNKDVSSPAQFSYGYMWWLFDRFYDNPDFEGAYTAWGAFGQYITVIPKRNVVVVHKTTVDIYTLLNFSDRTSTPEWRYWWILRKLMLHRKPIELLAKEKSTHEIIEFIKTEYTKDSDYAISERLINEYGALLAEKGKHKEAIQFYELNLEIYPEGYYTHRVYDYYIESLRKLGRENEILPLMEKSFELNPWNKKLGKEIQELKSSS